MKRKESLQGRLLEYLSVFSNLVTAIGGVTAVVGILFGFLAYKLGLWWLAGVALVIGLGIGFLSGVGVHRSFSGRRNAPLGYRIEETTHDFRMADDPREFKRKLSRKIVAKRNQLYAIDGRVKSDADYVELAPTPGLKLFEPEGPAGGDRLVHYLAVFNPEVERGDSRDIDIEHVFTYSTKVCKPECVHRSVVWSNVVKFLIQLPPKYVLEGSFAFKEIEGEGLGATVRRDMTDLLDFVDAQNGLVTASFKNPKPNRRYVLSWQWSDLYKKIYES